ncbi:MAG TPA: DUF3300 domain-containing protein [Paraburkholderia sp.]|uniref:DUF3300 domain-containing protein n=1 Tax=Paraburkholderia sp. TaxID=1926495 RepID=UPI002B4802F3|nr:DUF3300 domain-containing protein [Paraburkholderia sp.]HKR46816.1 DUF3300 domain-containing protein [Paraburkholderia sp.]
MKTSGASQRLAWLVCATLAGAPLFVGPVGPTAAFAQNAAHFSNQQLDSLTAPIALYPDALLAQVLMATTFPQDVSAAAAWSKANPNVKGDDAVKAVASEPWDPSVQSLVAFPQALATMASKPEWVQQIGDAFLAQPNDVMDSVQRLRAQAQKAGNLKSNEQQKVVVQPASGTSTTQTIVIEPTNPQVVYVPTYNPTVVFGAWPYPAYPPVYMPPPPGYAMATAFVGGLAFGAGVAVANSLWGGVNWGTNNVNVNVNRYNNINVNNRINTTNATQNWNSNANVQRRQQNINNANLNGQRGQYRGYDQSRTQAMQTLQNRTGQNMSGSAQQRYQGIEQGGRPNANGGNAPNANRGNELNNRAQNGAQNANRGNELNNRAQNGAQNANRSNDLNNRAQNTNRDNALRGAGDGSNARLEQQRGQQSREAFQSHGGGGGFNGGGGGFHGGGGGGFGGGGGGGGRHIGRR